MRRGVKGSRRRHEDVCAQMNWQIRQQERYIRENCSFFAFVGSLAIFPRPPQVNRSVSHIEIGGVQVGKSEPSYVSGKDFALEEVPA